MILVTVWTQSSGYADRVLDGFRVAPSQAIVELLEHHEINKNEERSDSAHQTFRWFLPGLASIRLQSGEQGIPFSLIISNLMDSFDGGMPSRGTKSCGKAAAERAAKQLRQRKSASRQSMIERRRELPNKRQRAFLRSSKSNETILNLCKPFTPHAIVCQHAMYIHFTHQSVDI